MPPRPILTLEPPSRSIPVLAAAVETDPFFHTAFSSGAAGPPKKDQDSLSAGVTVLENFLQSNKYI